MSEPRQIEHSLLGVETVNDSFFNEGRLRYDNQFFKITIAIFLLSRHI